MLQTDLFSHVIVIQMCKESRHLEEFRNVSYVVLFFFQEVRYIRIIAEKAVEIQDTQEL